MRNTSAGALQAFNNAWGDLLEVIGSKITPILVKVANTMTDSVIPALTSFVNDPIQGMKNMYERLNTIGKMAVALSGAFLTFKVAGKTWSLLSNVVKSGASIIASAFKTIFSWPTLIIAGIYLLRVAWINNWGGMRDFFLEFSNDVWNGVGGAKGLGNIWKDSKEELIKTWDNNSLTIFQKLKTTISTIAVAVGDSILSIGAAITKSFGGDSERYVETITKSFEKLGESVKNLDFKGFGSEIFELPAKLIFSGFIDFEEDKLLSSLSTLLTNSAIFSLATGSLSIGVGMALTGEVFFGDGITGNSLIDSLLKSAGAIGAGALLGGKSGSLFMLTALNVKTAILDKNLSSGEAIAKLLAMATGLTFGLATGSGITGSIIAMNIALSVTDIFFEWEKILKKNKELKKMQDGIGLSIFVDGKQPTGTSSSTTGNTRWNWSPFRDKSKIFDSSRINTRNLVASLNPVARREIEPEENKYIKDISNQLSTDFDSIKKIVDDVANKLGFNSDEMQKVTEQMQKSQQELEKLTLNKKSDVENKNAEEVEDNLRENIKQFSIGGKNITENILPELFQNIGGGLQTGLESTLISPLEGVMKGLDIFAKGLSFINVIISILGIVFGGMLRILQPVINSILAPFIKFFGELGEMLGIMLVPALQLIGAILQITIIPLMNAFGVAINAIVSVFSWFGDSIVLIINNIASFFHWIPGIGAFLSDEEKKKMSRGVGERIKERENIGKGNYDIDFKSQKPTTAGGDTYQAGSTQNITYNNYINVDGKYMTSGQMEDLAELIAEKISGRKDLSSKIVLSGGGK